MVYLWLSFIVKGFVTTVRLLYGQHDDLGHIYIHIEWNKQWLGNPLDIVQSRSQLLGASYKQANQVYSKGIT